MFPKHSSKSYDDGWSRAEPLLDGAVDVFVHSSHPHEYVALGHPTFCKRRDVYPDSRQPAEFVAFYSLWCRAVAELLLRYHDAGRADVFHSLDCAPAPIERATS